MLLLCQDIATGINNPIGSNVQSCQYNFSCTSVHILPATKSPYFNNPVDTWTDKIN